MDSTNAWPSPPGDDFHDPDFCDPACVAAWEQLVERTERRDMSLFDAERTWREIWTTLTLARLHLDLAKGRGAVPITVQRAAALADRAERHALYPPDMSGPGVCCEVCGQVWSARSSSVKEVPVAQRVSGGAGESLAGELGRARSGRSSDWAEVASFRAGSCDGGSGRAALGCSDGPGAPLGRHQPALSARSARCAPGRARGGFCPRSRDGTARASKLGRRDQPTCGA